jgi:hypothetical protein
VRKQGEGDKGQMSLDSFVKLVEKEIKETIEK